MIIREGKERKSLVYETREHAEQVRAKLLAGLEARANRAIGDALKEYLSYKSKRGCCDGTLTAVRNKLIPFLPVEQTLAGITPHKAQRLYEAHAERFSVATHQQSLRDARAFFDYCVRQKYITANPFSGVLAIGKPNEGKPQLRTDEARKLSDFLIKEASQGDNRALPLMVQVLLGLRSSEVLKLRKRDLDCRATVVVVEGTKSKNAQRTLELDAPVVRDLLLRRCAALSPEGFLFAADGATRPRWPQALWRWLLSFCQRAGVPSVCPHSLRGLHSSLAVKAGATSTYVAQALGHGSDSATRRHSIAPGTMESLHAARVAGALLGESDLEGLIGTLRNLPSQQLDRVCLALGLRR